MYVLTLILLAIGLHHQGKPEFFRLQSTGWPIVIRQQRLDGGSNATEVPY